MKRLLLNLIIIGLLLNQLKAQNPYIDSLRLVLQTQKADTNKVLLLANLAYLYQSVRLDSGILFAHQGLALARQLHFDKGEANCLNSLGSLFFSAGNYPKALEFQLEALRIRERNDNKRGQAVSYNNIGTIYSMQEDYEQALRYFYKAKTLNEATKAEQLLSGVLSNIGDTYERSGRLDSARIYMQQAYELDLKLMGPGQQGIILNNLGNVYVKMKQPELALGFYRLGLPELIQMNDPDAICETTLGMARAFDGLGNRDSARLYGRRSYDIAIQNGYAQRVLDASYFLARYFNQYKHLDSAYYYQGVIIKVKDSLFSQERVRQLQNLSFNEQIRQQEIAEAAIAAQEERWRNIQMLAIGAFIPLFFGVILLISKRTAKQRTIEFLGLLGLLLLFETITLYLHPYIERWTHHSPIFMLLILVVIASVLVPLHHKMEHWVKELLKKNRKGGKATPN